MAFDIGTHTQYDDPTSILNPEILGVAKAINLGKLDAVIYNRIGAPQAPVDQEMFRIATRSKGGITGTIGDGGGNGWNNSATTGLKMTAAQINAMTVGTVLSIGYTGATPETVVVSSVDRSGNTISVQSRGVGGTTPGTWADATVFLKIGHAINDLDAPNVEAFQEQTADYENYCQLFYEMIDETYTDEVEARKYFDKNPVIQQEALLRVYRSLAYTTIWGNKQKGTKTASPMTAGLLTQLSDSTAAFSGTRPVLRTNVNGHFSEAVLKTALDTVLALGTPNAIYMSLNNAKILFPTTEKFIIMTPDQSQKAGTDNVKQYEYRNQVFDIVIDAAMPDSRVCVVNESKIFRTWKVNDILRFVPEPPISSRRRKYSYQGKYAMIVTGVGYEHIDLYGIN